MLEMYRGDTYKIDLVIVNDQTGDVIDITGATMKFMAKRNVSDADAAAVVTKMVGAGVTLTDALNGKAQVVLLPADTSNLIETVQLECEAQMTLAGDVFTVASQPLLVRADVVRGASS